MCPPHGGVLCHREAHIEVDEGGAPGFYTHGAKLMLVDGEGAKLTPEALAAAIDPIRHDVHQVQPHALSLTQATEYGRVYTPDELAALAAFGARARARPAHRRRALRQRGRVPRLRAVRGLRRRRRAQLRLRQERRDERRGDRALRPALADLVRYRRKRAGHLQSKGRFLAAQMLALLDGDLWLANARAANAAAEEIAAGCGERLLHPVEANELFVCADRRRGEALRAQGFDFYDWGEDAARLVTAWNSDPREVAALANALAAL